MRALGLLEPMSALALGTAYNRFCNLTNRLFTSLCLFHRFYFQRCLSQGCKSCWYFLTNFMLPSTTAGIFCYFIFKLFNIKTKVYLLIFMVEAGDVHKV